MAYIETSIPPMKVFVRRSFLNGNIDDKSYEQAVLISVRCLEGSAALFQILTETGRMRDKLPLSAFCWKIPDSEDIWEKYPFHSLQLWDCFSRDFSIVQLSYVFNCRTTVLMKDRSQLEGQYQWTIQWAGNTNLGGADITLAEDGSEHKCHHFIRLDNGLFALQPNNRILKWNEPSFCTKPIGKDEAPWVVNEAEYCCEQHEKWTTEDTKSYFYQADASQPRRDQFTNIYDNLSYKPDPLVNAYLKDGKIYPSKEEADRATAQTTVASTKTAGKDAAADFAWKPDLSPAAKALSDELRKRDLMEGQVVVVPASNAPGIWINDQGEIVPPPYPKGEF